MVIVILLCFLVVGSLAQGIDMDQVNSTKNVCVDCTRFGFKCTTRVSGWTAFKQSKFDQTLVKKVEDFADADPRLSNCVLDGYKITDEVETFICFWAPYLGCQAVASDSFINLEHMHATICQACSAYCICDFNYMGRAIDIRASSKYLALIIGRAILQELG